MKWFSLTLNDGIFEGLDLAGTTNQNHIFAVQRVDGNAGRIVATVLLALHAHQQHFEHFTTCLGRQVVQVGKDSCEQSHKQISLDYWEFQCEKKNFSRESNHLFCSGGVDANIDLECVRNSHHICRSFFF